MICKATSECQFPSTTTSNAINIENEWHHEFTSSDTYDMYMCVNFCSSILLGSHGIDVPKVSQKLDSLNAAMTLEPIEPVWETDIEVRA